MSLSSIMDGVGGFVEGIGVWVVVWVNGDGGGISVVEVVVL